MNSRTILAAAALSGAVLCAPAADARRAAHPHALVCQPTTVFAPGLDHLDGYRVYIGPDGDSAVAPLRIDARIVPLLKTGKKLAIIDLPRAGERAPEIVVGAADVELALHPAPYREMFILLGGSFTFRTAKFSAAMLPGSVLMFEDVDARTGHGGHIGPCGYVSLSIAPPNVSVAPVPTPAPTAPRTSARSSSL